MKVAAIQMRTISGQIEKNQKNGEKFVLDAIHKGAQLIVLPELWSSGYHLSKESFMKLQPKTKDIVERFCDIAKKHQVVLVVPFIDKQQEDLFIALALIENTGEVIYTYHKSFLWNKEKLYFQPGKLQFEPIQTSVGKLGTLICYDMEFPETSRMLALAGAELIIIPSIFSFESEKRWDIQLPARAVDNTVFILGVNAVGENSFGKSKVMNPRGAIVREAARLNEEILLCDIDFNEINIARKNIPYLHDLDPTLYPGVTK